MHLWGFIDCLGLSGFFIDLLGFFIDFRFIGVFHRLFRFFHRLFSAFCKMTTVPTRRRTPRACTGRFPWSSWVQMAYLDARCRCPPLPSRQLQRGASARCWRPPQVPAMSLSVPAPTAALLRHPQHPWEGEPRSVFDLSGGVGPERANCPRLCRILHVHEIRGTADIYYIYTVLR